MCGVKFLVLSTQERTGKASLPGCLFMREIASRYDNQVEATLASNASGDQD